MPEFVPYIVAAVYVPVRYECILMVETNEGEFLDLRRWFTDESNYHNRPYLEEIIGMKVADVQDRLHRDEVRYINSWV